MVVEDDLQEVVVAEEDCSFHDANNLVRHT